MKIKCKKIVGGFARGSILYSDQPINFLGMIDIKTGMIIDQNHKLKNQIMKDRILVFPNAIGSSVGAYTIFSLKNNGTSPKGIICTNIVDITTASGSAISKIPLVVLQLESEKKLLLDYMKNSSKHEQDEIILDSENEIIIIEDDKSI